MLDQATGIEGFSGNQGLAPHAKLNNLEGRSRLNLRRYPLAASHQARCQVTRPTSRHLFSLFTSLFAVTLLAACNGGLTVTPPPTAPALLSWSQGNGPFSLHIGEGAVFQNVATFNSGGLVSYSVANSGGAAATVHSVSGIVTLGSGAGIVTVTASVPATGSYGAGAAQYNIVISTLPPNNVRLDATTAKRYGDADFSPATCDSGSPSYESDNAAVARVVSGKVQIVAPGSATITATCVGDGSNTADGMASTFLTVSKVGTVKVDPVVSLDTSAISNFMVGSDDIRRTMTVGAVGVGATPTGFVSCSSSSPAVAACSGTGLITARAAGSATITLTYPGDSNYNAISKTISVTVVTGISPTLTTWTQGTGPFSLHVGATFQNVATFDSGGLVSYSVANSGGAAATVNADNGTVTVGSTAGSITVTASVPATGSYGAGAAQYNIVISTLPPNNVRLDATTAKRYGDADFSPATCDSGSPSYTSDNTAVASVVSGKVHIAVAGSATITAACAGVTGSTAEGTATTTLTVSKVDPVVSLDTSAISNFMVGSDDIRRTMTVGAVGVGATPTGFVNCSSSAPAIAACSGTGLITARAAGSATITLTYPGDTNYTTVSRDIGVAVVDAPAPRYVWAGGITVSKASGTGTYTNPLTASVNGTACTSATCGAISYSISQASESGPITAFDSSTGQATIGSVPSRITIYLYTITANQDAKPGVHGPGTTSYTLYVVEAPPVPSNFRATPGIRQVSLSWSASPYSGITGYKLTRNGTQVGGNITTASYTDIGLESGTSYSYSLKTCRDDGCSETAATATVTTPSGFVVTLVANGGDLGNTTQLIANGGSTVPSGTSGLPTRIFYRLSGWNTQADGKGTAFVFGTTVVNADITIYAQWVVSKLPHSGITPSQCYASGRDTLEACSGSTVTALNGQQDGHRASINARSYSQVDSYSKEECVKDDLTGLIWEGKTASGTRAGSNTYTNYDVSYSGTQAQMDAATNSYGYVAAVNALNLCGYSDWRLPTVDELHTLVDYGVSSGTRINSTWFPNTGAVSYWTSSPGKEFYDFGTGAVDSSNSAWFVLFGSGGIYYIHVRGDVLRVRLVRASR